MVCGEDIRLNHPSWANNYEQDLNPEDQNINLLADLINNSTHSWNINTVKSLYNQSANHEILRIPIPKTGGRKDKLLWKHSSLGDYQVDKTYNLLH